MLYRTTKHSSWTFVECLPMTGFRAVCWCCSVGPRTTRPALYKVVFGSVGLPSPSEQSILSKHTRKTLNNVDAGEQFLGNGHTMHAPDTDHSYFSLTEAGSTVSFRDPCGLLCDATVTEFSTPGKAKIKKYFVSYPFFIWELVENPIFLRFFPISNGFV